MSFTVGLELVMQSVEMGIKDVEKKIKGVEKEVNDVEVEIKETSKEIEVGDTKTPHYLEEKRLLMEERQRLWEKKRLLWEEERQLREEKIQLMEEERQLRKKKIQLMEELLLWKRELSEKGVFTNLLVSDGGTNGWFPYHDCVLINYTLCSITLVDTSFYSNFRASILGPKCIFQRICLCFM